MNTKRWRKERYRKARDLPRPTDVEQESCRCISYRQGAGQCPLTVQSEHCDIIHAIRVIGVRRCCIDCTTFRWANIGRTRLCSAPLLQWIVCVVLQLSIDMHHIEHWCVFEKQVGSLQLCLTAIFNSTFYYALVWLVQLAKLLGVGWTTCVPFSASLPLYPNPLWRRTPFPRYKAAAAWRHLHLACVILTCTPPIQIHFVRLKHKANHAPVGRQVERSFRHHIQTCSGAN
jgi:hypothetical protein